MTKTLPAVGFVSQVESSRSGRTRLVVKRGFDVVFACSALVLLSPVLVLIAIVLLISEGRPILFRQRRVGRYGEPFTMWKFRTMVVDAEDQLHGLRATNERTGPLFKMALDPRVTRIGRFLRSTSLDELPQLANVVGGTMSMVGPRPALYEERESFAPELLAREEMPPGITGLWQVEARTDGDFDRYRQLDQQYVNEWTLRLDLWLLIRTPLMLVRHALTPIVDSVEPATAAAATELVIPLEPPSTPVVHLDGSNGSDRHSSFELATEAG